MYSTDLLCTQQKPLKGSTTFLVEGTSRSTGDLESPGTISEWQKATGRLKRSVSHCACPGLHLPCSNPTWTVPVDTSRHLSVLLSSQIRWLTFTPIVLSYEWIMAHQLCWNALVFWRRLQQRPQLCFQLVPRARSRWKPQCWGAVAGINFRFNLSLNQCPSSGEEKSGFMRVWILKELQILKDLLDRNGDTQHSNTKFRR